MGIAATHTPLHRPAGTGRNYWGPGDMYTFLVTGEESGGALFSMEAFVPPGGGPPPHIHEREDETFYVLEGQVTFRLGDETVVAGPGDSVHVPRGNIHNFRNDAETTARVILTFTPSGIEKFFEETLNAALDPSMLPPETVEEVAARYTEAAPRYGMTFVEEA
jgi:quercetin dioxygenase-like cupin family protein